MQEPGEQPELHVEVLLKEQINEDQPFQYAASAIFEAEVADWLHHKSGACLVNTDVAISQDELAHGYLLDSIRICEISGPETSELHFSLEDVIPKIHVYCLHGRQVSTKGPGGRQSLEGGENILELPSRALAGTWDSLMFARVNPTRILRSITRIITLMSQPGLNLAALDLNRLILLHGPPGCGKTTLCRALAQKLSIRLGGQFFFGKLFEINTQTLLSKYYSESGRLVSQMFERIMLLAQDKTTLVCVLIDEVESIASSREQLNESGECHDSIRATNQLLTALDRIRHQPNIVIFCTSNMKESIDTAFLDRVDYEVCIPAPCESAIYEILRTTINELVHCKLIMPSPCLVPESVLPRPEDRIYIPPHARLLYLLDYPECPAQVVARLAHNCKGLSGRKLRKLPLLAITTYTWGEKCSLEDALGALKRAVNEILVTKG